MYCPICSLLQPPCVFRTFAQATSPCSVCSTGILQLPDCLTEQAWGEVGWANVWKTQGGAVPSITNIYSLVRTVHTVQFHIRNHCELSSNSPNKPQYCSSAFPKLNFRGTFYAFLKQRITHTKTLAGCGWIPPYPPYLYDWLRLHAFNG